MKTCGLAVGLVLMVVCPYVPAVGGSFARPELTAPILYHISMQIFRQNNLDAVGALERAMPDLLTHEDSRAHYFDFEKPHMFCPNYRYITAGDVRDLINSLMAFCDHAVQRGDYRSAWRGLDLLADAGALPLNLTPPAQIMDGESVVSPLHLVVHGMWEVSDHANACIDYVLGILSAKSPGLGALLKPARRIVRDAMGRAGDEARLTSKMRETDAGWERLVGVMIPVYRVSFPQTKAALDSSLGKLVGLGDSSTPGSVQR